MDGQDIIKPGQDIIKPSQEIISRMQQDALGRLYSRLEAIEETYEANKPALNAKAAASSYWCTGWLSLTALLITTGIKIEDMEFNDFPEILKFKGTAYGLGIGVTPKTFGTGAFSEKPSRLIGKTMKIELAFLGLGPAGIQASFWEDGQLVGAMDFVGAGGGVGAFWGDGSFSEQ